MKKLYCLLILVFFTGCVTLPENIKTPESQESSIIGISIKIRSILRIFKNRPETVYFVKLGDEDDTLLGHKIFPSNYVKKDYAYLVNAKPGRYIAVASSFTKTDIGYNTFFNKNIIEKTAVEVMPGDIVFAGKFVIDDHLKNLHRNIEKNGDSAQLYYYKMLKSFMIGSFYCGTLKNVERSETAEKNFYIKAKEHFKESGWVEMIDKKTEVLKAP